LYSAEFSTPLISNYLREYYLHQGHIEFEYLKDEKYCLDKCNDCGFIYQRYIPNDFLMMKLYEQWIDPEKVFDSKGKGHGLDYYLQMMKQIEITLRHFNKDPSDLVYLDFGMGWGNWCNLAQAFGCSVFGMELSEVRNKFAKGLGIKVVSWNEIADYHYDFINAEQVFEHIANPLETLQYLAKALKPQGIIRINVPKGGWDIMRRLGNLDWAAPKNSINSLNVVTPLEHINCFTNSSLVKMGYYAGLSQVELNESNKIKINGQSILDFTLRDVFRPIYKKLFRLNEKKINKSTNLYFKRISL